MIKRIPKCYVSETCVQVRLPFNKESTLISSDFKNEGILCHYNINDDSQNINKYLTDNRRNIFPYSNIPIYIEWYGNIYDGLNKKYYINQILEFNKHYIYINDYFNIIDMYVVKDKEEAIIYSKNINIPNNLIEKETTRKKLFDELKDIAIVSIDNKGHYIEFKNNFNVFFNNYGGLVILVEENDIKFKIIKLSVKGRYCFKKEYIIPFNNYKLEELKAFETKIKNIKKPKIYKSINPNIDRKEIKEAKKKVKKLNKSK